MKAAMKFLKSYKGKNADMKIEKKLASMEYAETLVKEAHDLYNQVQARKVIPARSSGVRVSDVPVTHGNAGVRIVRR